jgi:hypothetical protein
MKKVSKLWKNLKKIKIIIIIYLTFFCKFLYTFLFYKKK